MLFSLYYNVLVNLLYLNLAYFWLILYVVKNLAIWQLKNKPFLKKCCFLPLFRHNFLYYLLSLFKFLKYYILLNSTGNFNMELFFLFLISFLHIIPTLCKCFMKQLQFRTGKEVVLILYFRTKYICTFHFRNIYFGSLWKYKRTIGWLS